MSKQTRLSLARRLWPLAFLAALTSCATAPPEGAEDAPGGEAASGVVPARAETPRAMAPADSELVETVSAALARDELLAGADIRIDARDGRVALRGRVPSVRAYIRAQSIVRSIQGVRPPVDVVDLTYPPPG
ncbi:MAG: BON domain-containing protein [Candidatus Competibacterales bacterium]